MTCVIASMSRPRAATSVATSVSRVAALRSARGSASRCDCVMSPCMAARRRRGARGSFARPARAALGAHEHQRELALASSTSTSVELLSGATHEPVLDLAPISASGVGLDARRHRRVAAWRAGRPRRPAWPRRRSSGAPAASRRRCGRRRAEAQVEHAVGLVQHEHGDAVERQQAPRRRDPRAGPASPPGCASGRPSGPGRGCRRRRRRWRRAGRGSAPCGASLVCDLHRRARGWAPARGRREPGVTASMRSTIGIAKAIVLPLPVGDLASTSRPASASGRTSSWMGKGSEMPRCAAQRRRARTRPGRGRTSYSMFNSWPSMRPVRGLRNRRAPRTDQEERRATSRSGTFRS